jgi:hypothetical protein
MTAHRVTHSPSPMAWTLTRARVEPMDPREQRLLDELRKRRERGKIK